MNTGRDGNSGVRAAALGALERYLAGERAQGPALEGGTVLPTRRREELVEHAASAWRIARPRAELVYDVAVECGLDPPFAFELVRSEVAVCGGPSERSVPPRETVLEGPPEWITPAEVREAETTEDVERERRLRLSFRRVRGYLEQSESAAAALGAFVEDPDVWACGYLI